MKKTTKGALAVTAAGVLLLGGAGTLAYWHDEAVVNGGSLTAGSLSLTEQSCDADWQLDGTGGTGGALAGRHLVPGDTVTKHCVYTVAADGAHMKADLDVAGPTDFLALGGPGDPSPSLADALDYSAKFKITGGSYSNTDVPAAGIDVKDGTYTLDALITIKLPFDGDPSTPGNDVDNSMQLGTVTLDDFQVLLNQVDNH